MKFKSTNQLEFIKNDVMLALRNHRLSGPFKEPVDTVKLEIPVSFLF